MSEQKMISIELPWPDSGLSPNARIDKFALAKFKEAAKVEAYYEARIQLGSEVSELISVEAGHIVLLTMVFYPPDHRWYDLDGLHSRMKAAIDGIALALDVNDRDFQPQLQDFGPNRKGGRVCVVVGGTFDDALRLARERGGA